MSKNIRNIVATMFILTAFSFIAPNSLNLTMTQAYAEDKPSLKSIYVSDVDDIRFSGDVHSYIVDFDNDKEDIFIRAKPEKPEDTVKINGQEVSKNDFYKGNVKLEKGKNIIEIEVIDGSTKSKTTYTINAYRGGKSAVYLNDININGKTIGFDKSSISYDLELDETSKIVDLETIPDKGKYLISVNDVELSEKNSIKLKFKDIGKYIIRIKLKDLETQREGSYTLNIYLGIAVSPNVLDSINNVLKPNQWILKYGRWRYNDSSGETLKDIWFYDKNYKSYFHFNSRGNMETGWIEDKGNHYYLNPNGAMHTGWLFDNDEWYYLSSDGVMRTGWIKYEDKWYYLSKDGIMSTGWIISNGMWYYLDSSGDMQTGWGRSGGKTYYLNEYGAMETGWIKVDNEWYYFNYDGSMKSGEWFYYNDNWYYLSYSGNMICGWFCKDSKYYYFNEDGAMRTTTINIDGYKYEFNDDGSVNFN
jgi:glucan-binding YG repeat protein